MKTYAYDVECLRTLFTATFVNVDDETDKEVFYVGADKKDCTDIRTFLKQEMLLVGYNNHSYDDPMLRFLQTFEGSNMTGELYKLSAKLIDDNFRGDKGVLKLRYPRDVFFKWKSIDLMKILGFDKLGISLKQVAISLKWHNIQDMPISHTTSFVHALQLESILSYNLNDVLITRELYYAIESLRNLREKLSAIYGTDLTSASDSKMANLILETIYAKELHVDIRAIREMRTPRERVYLGQCIASFVKFKSPALQEMLDRISATVVYSHTNYKYSETIYFANCRFSLGVGGLHTEDAPGIFVSDEQHLIQDMDVASYYPNLIITNEYYPEHLGIDFIQVLKRITEDRLAAKKSGDKVKADGLKITINSIFGKMGSEHFWLLDPKQMLSTTVSGQLGLLMLVEALHLGGIEVISANTDGVVCRIPRGLEDKYYEIAKQWEQETNMTLEFTPYVKYVRRDVNSYITVKEDGYTKEKGVFLKDVDLKKAFHMPIVAKALYGYFVQGVPVRDTILSSRDIMDFCISQKMSDSFVLEWHSKRGTELLQKTNRFYVSKTGGILFKRNKITKRGTGLIVGKTVVILNQYDSTKDFQSYNVDTAYYEKEVMKIVDEIEPKQLSLFSIGSGEGGTLSKMDAPEHMEDEPEVENETRVSELNRLGKNQLARKLFLIANAGGKVKNISPRYVYVLGMNAQKMEVTVYCLSKGITQTLPVNKESYKREILIKGLLVYCTKFEKKADGFVLQEYKVTERIEEDRQQAIVYS